MIPSAFQDPGTSLAVQLDVVTVLGWILQTLSFLLFSLMVFMGRNFYTRLREGEKERMADRMAMTEKHAAQERELLIFQTEITKELAKARREYTEALTLHERQCRMWQSHQEAK